MQAFNKMEILRDYSVNYIICTYQSLLREAFLFLFFLLCPQFFIWKQKYCYKFNIILSTTSGLLFSAI